jgi:hypothetical protein
MARYNRLLGVIRTSLVNLDKALQGLQVRHTHPALRSPGPLLMLSVLPAVHPLTL